LKRRDFLKASVITTATTVGLSGCSSSEDKSFNINKGKKTKIKIATSWPAHFPIIGEGVDEFAKKVELMSDGNLKVKVYPKNILVPALEVFDATSSGQIDAFHSGPYYWKGKNLAFSLFGGFPFGFTSTEMNAWLMYGGGLDIWRELYSKYNLYPLLGGNTDTQMGGWFKKEINSLNDLRGLKMRIPGLGGEVMAKMGVNPILLPAGDIFLALERGVIDATEWVGPALDINMGFHKVAKYYYTGWHEPGSLLELTFNKRKWDKLSDEHKAILETASNEMNSSMTYNFQAQNAKALDSISSLGVQIKSFPNEVILKAKESLDEVIASQIKISEDFKRVYSSADEFLRLNRRWTSMGIKSYLDTRG
jgi:TRAP-type mannitol/chloroaromatic compound transport system substrate-binding protein